MYQITFLVCWEPFKRWTQLYYLVQIVRLFRLLLRSLQCNFSVHRIGLIEKVKTRVSRIQTADVIKTNFHCISVIVH